MLHYVYVSYSYTILQFGLSSISTQCMYLLHFRLAFNCGFHFNDNNFSVYLDSVLNIIFVTVFFTVVTDVRSRSLALVPGTRCRNTCAKLHPFPSSSTL